MLHKYFPALIKRKSTHTTEYQKRKCLENVFPKREILKCQNDEIFIQLFLFGAIDNY